MKYLALLALFATACAAEPYAYSAPAYLEHDDGGCACVAEDDGVPETWSTGASWYGEPQDGLAPILLGRWEPLGSATARTLKLGSGQSSVSHRSLLDLQLDAYNLLAFQTRGVTRIKLHDHPSGERILHLSDTPWLWFGNTLRRPAQLHYQGTNGTGDARGEPMSIMGQSMNGASGATSATGGDLSVRAGSASSGVGPIPLDPGELILGGGKVGAVTRGNVALHDAPASWEGLEGGVFVHDVATVPTGAPTAGGFLYADGGALYWVGSAGTVTMVAAP